MIFAKPPEYSRACHGDVWRARFVYRSATMPPRCVAAARPIKGDFMTLVSRISVYILVALAAISGTAQTSPRHRAVSPGAASGPTTQVIFTVKDASNGVPVASATLTYAGQTQTTSSNGQAALNLPVGKPAIVTVAHPAFAAFSQTITAQTNGTYELTLTGKPSVTIKTKTNETHVVDIGTAQFAFAAVFS